MLKLKRHKEGIWVEYPHAVDVRLKIRPVTFSQSMSILTEVKEKVVVEGFSIDAKDPSKKGPQIVDNYKDGAFLWKMFDSALQEWEGIEIELDEGDAPLGPVEVKKVLYDNDQLREFVFEKARAFAQADIQKKEGETKN